MNLFHIALAKDWNEAKECYWPSINRSEKFIHFSFPHQVPEVLNRLFFGRKDLVLLEVQENALKDALKVEAVPNESEMYPHLYRSLLKSEVSRVIKLEPDGDGKFAFP